MSLYFLICLLLVWGFFLFCGVCFFSFVCIFVLCLGFLLVFLVGWDVLLLLFACLFWGLFGLGVFVGFGWLVSWGWFFFKQEQPLRDHLLKIDYIFLRGKKKSQEMFKKQTQEAIDCYLPNIM